MSAPPKLAELVPGAWVSPTRGTCPRCRAPVPGWHLCDACAELDTAERRAAADRARILQTFPPHLLRDRDGGPWTRGGAGPWLPPRSLSDLAGERRLAGAREACQRAAAWLGGRQRVLVLRGLPGSFKSTLAGAAVLAWIGGRGHEDRFAPAQPDQEREAWIVYAPSLCAIRDDPAHTEAGGAAGRAKAWARAQHLRALVTLDDVGAEIGDGRLSAQRVDDVRAAIQARTNGAARTIVTTSLGGDGTDDDFVAEAERVYQGDVSRRLSDRDFTEILHLRRRQ